MSDKKKGILAVLVAVAIVVLLWLLMRGRGAGANNNGSYLTYNQPGGSPWTGSAGGLPSIPADVADGSCGCSDNSSGGNYFGSLQDMLAAFSSGLGAWIQNVQSSTASLVAQYQNNPATVDVPGVSAATAFNNVSLASGASYRLG
jgi:hypothetical protein